MPNNEAMFFNRQLDTLDKKIYNKRYPNRQFAEGKILPITQNASKNSKTYTYRMYDRMGIAKIVNNFSKDFPRVSVKGQEYSINLRHVADSYGYNIYEIRRAMEAKIPLDTSLALAAAQAIMDKLDDIGINGEVESGINGLKQILDDYAQELVVLNDGTGSSKLFSDKTFVQIIRDLNELIFTIVNNTKEAETPNVLLLPLSTYNLICTTYNGQTDNTVKKLFLETNPYIKEIKPVYALETMGAGGTRRMVAFNNDPEKISFEIPDMMERFNPEQTGLSYNVKLVSTTAGVFSRYPLSMCFADGI